MSQALKYNARLDMGGKLENMRALVQSLENLTNELKGQMASSVSDDNTGVDWQR